jgi:hypothetical protein
MSWWNTLTHIIMVGPVKCRETTFWTHVHAKHFPQAFSHFHIQKEQEGANGGRFAGCLSRKQKWQH